MMTQAKTAEPTRVLETHYDANGRPYWKSMLSHKNVRVRGECRVPPQLPGIVIFVHGVNSTGEWYQLAENALCEGLNERLGLAQTEFKLSPNLYSCDKVKHNPDANSKKLRKLITAGRSPVIRFYWGYRSPEGEEDRYTIPLVNINNEDYHQLKENGADKDTLRHKGPWFWGGGPFQNGTTQLFSLWSKQGFDGEIAGFFPVQWLSSDLDRLMTDAPPREYYAHAAQRLANLLNRIREHYPADTVSIISHSQGTMIAMAATALAKQAPDALFILNSPYAITGKLLDNVYPAEEVLSDAARTQTLSAIIDKVAARAGHLSPDSYNTLCVGQTDEKKRWRPDVTLPGENAPDGSVMRIAERDNHGRVYIYSSPHDRVMGALPLLSLGWCGLPNNYRGESHPLLVKHKGRLFQRILARATPCGVAPNPKTSFVPTDGKPFWDDDGSFPTYRHPGYITLNINAEQVPQPFYPDQQEQILDKTRVGKKENPGKKMGEGWGQFHKDKDGDITANDDTFDNHIYLYPRLSVSTGQYENHSYGRVPVTRLETDQERRARIGKYIPQPSDHSALPENKAFMSKVVAFDLPVGLCEMTFDRAFMADLRRYADWTQSDDDYFNSGKLTIPPVPDIIQTESTRDEMQKILNAPGRSLPSTRRAQ